MNKGFWALTVLLIGAMVGLFVLTADEKTPSTAKIYDPAIIQLDDNIIGLGDQDVSTRELLDAALADRVVVMEYGDFQCPACSQFYPVLKQIEVDFQDDIVVIFRHMPLTNIHPQAMAAHRATVAAANQGMFWPMHDLMYQRQTSWTGETDAYKSFESYAAELNLDIAQYKIDVDSEATFDKITNDLESSKPFGVTGTPTLIVDGEKLDSTPGYDELTAVITAAVASKEADQ